MADDTQETVTTETTEIVESTGDDMPEGAKRALAAARKDFKDADKARKALEQQVREFQDRDKTDMQKLAERAEAAEKAATTNAAQLMKYQVAAAKKLPVEFAGRLQGGTQEELEADADNFLALIQSSGGATSFDGGARSSAPAPTDMNSIIRRAAGIG